MPRLVNLAFDLKCFSCFRCYPTAQVFLNWKKRTTGKQTGFNLLIICNIILIYWLHEKVSLSSLNRHAVAMREDVGIPKAECLKKHFSAIFPECQIDARVLLYDASSEEDILSGDPDFVLDCIDNIDTKVTQLA